MNNIAKNIVQSFYNTDLLNTPEAFSEYLHPDFELHWNSSFGFSKKNFDDIKSMFLGMSNSFESFRCKISHLLSENDIVTIRFTYFAATIERPEKEEALAHFIAIWELKDNKLYKGYQISQHGDNTSENLASFISI
ncbi:nuclear transport factor 2 family protein [Aquimarina sp. RZ0]|uniref:nuclear transport factor 2 family protein n=1 Tax=Aquimarina sp. RZ0 TaxID=2607730 RepID=UPI0011F37CB6|nr:nuclear transport factor 2 family protein [Aquimarina sp. RZ0]KAA1242762.1 nuclear transport factor 2 family protein [Aquimarina sp. RZ0]